MKRVTISKPTILEQIFELQSHPITKIYEICKEIIDTHDLGDDSEGCEDEQMEIDSKQIENISSIKANEGEDGSENHIEEQYQNDLQ